MTLTSSAANVDFSQWSLRIFGHPKASRKAGNLGMARMFDGFALERKTRVPQPPKMRKIIGVKKSA